MRSPAAEAFDRGWSQGWRPLPERSVAEWADSERYLTGRSASEPGRWRTTRFPFTRSIMDDLSPDSLVERVVVMSARQMAKSEILLNFMGHTIVCRPRPMLIVQPTIENAKKFSKQRVAPVIESSPNVRARVRAYGKSRDSGDTLLVKGFDDGILMLGGANSSASLRSMPVGNLAGDEIEEWPADVDGQGDPLAIAEECTANFPGRKVLLTGNPGVLGRSRTHTEFLRGDQRRYFIPCQRCGHMDFLTWQGRDWFGGIDGSHHRIDWEQGDPNSAHMVCGTCGGSTEEFEKTKMLAGGEWRATAAGDGITHSYHITGLYSPYGFRSWALCAITFLQAKDNPDALRSFVNNVLGEPFEDRGERVQVEDLLDDKRHDDYGVGIVPHGVGVLVAATDCQADRLVHLVMGFGAGEESWVIDWHELPGDPRKNDVWFELDASLALQFTHASGRKMPIKRMTVDSGGKAGVTDHVYRYCAARVDRGVFAVKGDVTRGKPLVGMPSTRNRYRTPLFLLCVDSGKADIVARLRMRRPDGQTGGPGYMHFPKGLDEEFFRQLTSEKAVYKRAKAASRGAEPGHGITQREWIQTYPRNHVFDLSVYSLAALRMLGPKFVRDLGARAAEWSRPLDGPAPDQPRDGDTASVSPAPVAPQPPPMQRRSSWVNAALPPGRRR